MPYLKGNTMDEGVKSKIELYENGKDRRYKLLFAVNGGTLAIAKFLAGDAKDEIATVLGGMQLSMLSAGMIIFTIAMVWDIYAFGSKMHDETLKLFQLPGKI